MYSTRLVFCRPLQYQPLMHYSRISREEAPPPDRPPGFLKRWEIKLESQRKALEDQALAQYEAGKSSRLSPAMKQRFDEFMDADKTLKKRQILMKEAFEKGYFDDAKEVVRAGAKLWDASTRLASAQASPLIPDIQATNLIGHPISLRPLAQKYKLSLITFVYSAFGDPHVKSFKEPFLREFTSSEIGLIQVNVEENTFKVPVLWAMRPFIKRGVPVDQRENYLIYYKNMAEERRAVGMTNSVLGWVNLVDSFGRIRWQAHGIAKEEELSSLSRLSRELLEEHNV